MSTVQEIETAISRLSPEEMLRVRDLLENMLEDQLAIHPEFEARIRRSEADMAAGLQPRVR